MHAQKLTSFLFRCAIFAVLVMPAPLRSNEITEVSIRHYDRYWRVTLFMPEKPVYSVSDNANSGEILVSLDARAAANLVIPQSRQVLLTVTVSGARTMVNISMAHAFHFDHFYFSQGQKLIIDLYPDRSKPIEQDYYRLGISALQAGDTLNAVASLLLATNQGDNAAKAFFQLGQIDYAQNALDRAKDNFESAIEKGLPVSDAIDYLDNIALKHKIHASPHREAGPNENKATRSGDKDEGREGNKTAGTNPAENRHSGNPGRIIVATRSGARSLVKKTIAVLEEPAVAISGAIAATGLLSGLLVWLMVRRRAKKNSRPPGKGGAHPQAASLPRRRKKNRRRFGIFGRRRRIPHAENLLGGNKSKAPDDADIRSMMNFTTDNIRPKRAKYFETPADDYHLSNHKNNVDGSMDSNRFSPSLRAEIKQLAIEGMSVQDIAKALDLGVGEVELLLGFSDSSSGKDSSAYGNGGIDFSF